LLAVPVLTPLTCFIAGAIGAVQELRRISDPPPSPRFPIDVDPDCRTRDLDVRGEGVKEEGVKEEGVKEEGVGEEEFAGTSMDELPIVAGARDRDRLDPDPMARLEAEAAAAAVATAPVRGSVRRTAAPGRRPGRWLCEGTRALNRFCCALVKKLCSTPCGIDLLPTPIPPSPLVVPRSLPTENELRTSLPFPSFPVVMELMGGIAAVESPLPSPSLPLSRMPPSAPAALGAEAGGGETWLAPPGGGGGGRGGEREERGGGGGKGEKRGRRLGPPFFSVLLRDFFVPSSAKPFKPPVVEQLPLHWPTGKEEAFLSPLSTLDPLPLLTLVSG